MARRMGKYKRSKKIKRSKPQRQYTTTESRGVTHSETGWSYVQSQQQVFFVFNQDIISPAPIYSDDVIGIFKGNTCVGWDYIGDIATGGYMDIGMMLRDVDIVSNFLTEEQCAQAGGSYNSSNGVCNVAVCETVGTCDYPPNNSYFYPSCNFKYYNSQTGEISNLVNPDLTGNFLLNNTQIFQLYDYDGMWITESVNSINLHSFANLISLPYNLTDASLGGVFGTNGPVWKVVGQGVASQLIGGVWQGSVSNINPLSGYWAITESAVTLDVEGTLIENPIYELNPGATLISYPYSSEMNVGDVLPSNAHEYIDAIVTEAQALIYTNENGWVGSLTTFEPNKGYWIRQIYNEYSDFQFGGQGTTFSYTQFDFTWPTDIHEMGINNLITNLIHQTLDTNNNLINLRKRRKR